MSYRSFFVSRLNIIVDTSTPELIIVLFEAACGQTNLPERFCRDLK